ncbi:hypothetical protein [Pyrococcus kukulkanii]|uniref:hypothetical protein n=1 Tax=Pyrococcus kukulkanii TaxID=1609559 RepID=UPI003569AC4C
MVGLEKFLEVGNLGAYTVLVDAARTVRGRKKLDDYTRKEIELNKKFTLVVKEGKEFFIYSDPYNFLAVEEAVDNFRDEFEKTLKGEAKEVRVGRSIKSEWNTWKAYGRLEMQREGNTIKGTLTMKTIKGNRSSFRIEFTILVTKVKDLGREHAELLGIGLGKYFGKKASQLVRPETVVAVERARKVYVYGRNDEWPTDWELRFHVF